MSRAGLRVIPNFIHKTKHMVEKKTFTHIFPSNLSSGQATLVIMSSFKRKEKEKRSEWIALLNPEQVHFWICAKTYCVMQEYLVPSQLERLIQDYNLIHAGIHLYVTSPHYHHHPFHSPVDLRPQGSDRMLYLGLFGKLKTQGPCAV